MSTLLVAPGGGHLEEMWQLHQRLPLDDDVLWVTTDTDQSRSMLANASTSFEAAVAQASGRRVTIAGKPSPFVLKRH